MVEMKRGLLHRVRKSDVPKEVNDAAVRIWGADVVPACRSLERTSEACRRVCQVGFTWNLIV